MKQYFEISLSVLLDTILNEFLDGEETSLSTQDFATEKYYHHLAFQNDKIDIELCKIFDNEVTKMEKLWSKLNDIK